MLFTSYLFIGFVLLTLLLYYSFPKRFQWMILLFASMVFYAYSGIGNLIYILTTVLTTYLAATQIGRLQNRTEVYISEHRQELSREERKTYKAAMKKKQRLLMVSCLVFNLGILAVIKYSNFTIDNINKIADMFHKGTISFLDIALPMGISFYTFQTMSYLIDVYRAKHPPEKNIFRLALFTSFFPQIIQGPISRYEDLSQTLYGSHDRNGREIMFGLQRVLWGFFKKLVIADRMVIAVNTIINNTDDYSGIYVFLLMILYSIELYADFTGGIDITIGIAQMFGIKMKENFERPYFSKSITEFWRRWHITMGTWFKDYIFYPISVSQPMLKLSKNARKWFGDALGKRMPVYLATIVTWFATGIWHGASWNFIVWGLLNCLVIMISQEFTPLYERFHRHFPYGNTTWYRAFQILRTFLLMSAIRVLDCYRNVGLTFKMAGTIFTDWNLKGLLQGGWNTLGLTIADIILLCAAVLLVFMVSMLQRSGSVRVKIEQKGPYAVFAVFLLLFVGILIFGAYGTGYDSNQFIYNQF